MFVLGYKERNGRTFENVEQTDQAIKTFLSL